MARDKERKPDGGQQQGSGEPAERDSEKEGGKFAGDNRSLQDDKSIGEDADRGQRGSQGGNKRGGSKR